MPLVLAAVPGIFGAGLLLDTHERSPKAALLIGAMLLLFAGALVTAARAARRWRSGAYSYAISATDFAYVDPAGNVFATPLAVVRAIEPVKHPGRGVAPVLSLEAGGADASKVVRVELDGFAGPGLWPWIMGPASAEQLLRELAPRLLAAAPAAQVPVYEGALPVFGARDRALSAASAAAYGLLVVGAALRARASGAAGCALAGGRWFGAELPLYIVLLGLPVAALTAGLIQRRRHDDEGGRTSMFILLFLALASGVPLSGVVPWGLMTAGYCVDAGSIRETTLRGTGEALAFARVTSAQKTPDHLLLELTGAPAMTVALSSMRDPVGLTEALMSALRRLGLVPWYENRGPGTELLSVVASTARPVEDAPASPPDAGAVAEVIPGAPTLDVAAWRTKLDAEDLSAIMAWRADGEIRWRVTARGSAPEDLEAMRARCAALRTKAAPHLELAGHPELSGPDSQRAFGLGYEASDLVATTRVDAGTTKLVTTIEGAGVVWKDRAAYVDRRDYEHEKDWLSLLERLRRAHGLRFHVRPFTLARHEDTSRPELTLPDDWESLPAARRTVVARETWGALSEHYRKYHRWWLAPVKLYAGAAQSWDIKDGRLLPAGAE